MNNRSKSLLRLSKTSKGQDTFTWAEKPTFSEKSDESGGGEPTVFGERRVLLNFPFSFILGPGITAI